MTYLYNRRVSFFNKIVKKQISFGKGFFLFTLLSLFGFGLLVITFFFFGEMIFKILFSINISNYYIELYSSFLVGFVSVLSYWILRLSVFLKIERLMLSIFLISLLSKLVFLFFKNITLINIVLSNIIFFASISLLFIFTQLGWLRKNLSHNAK